MAKILHDADLMVENGVESSSTKVDRLEVGKLPKVVIKRSKDGSFRYIEVGELFESANQLNMTVDTTTSRLDLNEVGCSFYELIE